MGKINRQSPEWAHWHDIIKQDIEEQNTYRLSTLRAAGLNMGVSGRTVRRTYERMDEPEVEAVPDEWLAQIAALQSMHGAWKVIHDRGEFPQGYEAFRRRVMKAGQGMMAAILDGEETERDTWVYLRFLAAHVNDCWQADIFDLDVYAVGPRRSTLRGEVLVFLDDRSRYCMGLSFRWHPDPKVSPDKRDRTSYFTAEDVAVGFADAALGDTIDGKFYGGVTKRLRVDMGSQFTADYVGDCLEPLNTVRQVLPGNSGWLKGKVERIGMTVQEECLWRMPGSSHYPHLAGQADKFDPRTKRFKSTAEVERDVRAYFHYYNHERPHEALSGRTPAKAVEDDGGMVPPSLSETAALRQMLLRENQTRQLGKNGVMWNDVYYVAPDMTGEVNPTRSETIHIGVRPSQEPWKTIEVFRNRKWWCTAFCPSEAIKRAKQFIAKREALHQHGERVKLMAAELKDLDGSVPKSDVRGKKAGPAPAEAADVAKALRRQRGGAA